MYVAPTYEIAPYRNKIEYIESIKKNTMKKWILALLYKTTGSG